MNKPRDSERKWGTIDLIRSQHICHHPHLPIPEREQIGTEEKKKNT